jgi:hypothetical protein
VTQQKLGEVIVIVGATTHEKYLQKLSQDPRAKKSGKSGEGFTIVGAEPPKQDT